MKRLVFSLITVMLVALCIFAACTEDNADPQESTQSQADSSEASKNDVSLEVSEIFESSVREEISEIVEISSESSENESSLPEQNASKDPENENSRNESSALQEPSSAESSLPEQSVPVSSLPEDSSAPDESSEPEEIYIRPDDAIKVLYARYTDYPTFVMIGTCAQDAEVTAVLNGESVTVNSYKGWFSVSFTRNGDIHGITFTQKVKGTDYDIPHTYQVRPTEPGNTGAEVVAGTNDFQFFLEKMLPDYMGTNLYSSSALNGMKSRVSSRLNELKSINPQAEIIYLTVPSAMTIYPELVPSNYKKSSGTTRLDQVNQALESAGATVIDLRDVFKANKNSEMPLYYKLDSHWADYGAYLAYVELFDHISEKFPAAKPRAVSEFNWKADYYTSADMTFYLGIPQTAVDEYGYYRTFNFQADPQITSVPRYRGNQLLYNDMTTYEYYFDTNRSDLPSCIVHRDSYSAAIFDLIPERMDVTHYMGMWSYGWQSYAVQSERPDYVIYLIAEWNLDAIVYN